VVLDRGRIVEVGSHDELLDREGIYHRLHSLQETGQLL
jgi:ATP-binding cassette subfamily B protein